MVINEFVSSNGSTIADENGDYEDWIELYNPSGEAIGLEGYGLSDDEDRPFRWVFPDIQIGAGEYLLVWASGKDRTNPLAPLHTNFAISASGEELLLTTPDGEVIDFVPPIRLDRDTSYGRKPDGADSWFIFTEPTPGVSNTTEGFDTILSAPDLSHTSGFHPEPFDLQILSKDKGVIIRYTTDGSIPGPDSPVFSDILHVHTRENDPNGISMIQTNDGFQAEWVWDIAGWRPPSGLVAKATVVRLRAFRDGSLPSPIVNRTFWVGESFIERYHLPVFSLIVEEDDFFDHDRGIYVPGAAYREDVAWPEIMGNYFHRGMDWERPVHLEFFEPGWEHGFSLDGGVRIHGGLTRRWPIKSLRIYMRGDYEVSNLEYPLFPNNPVTTFRRFILRNAGNDSGFEYWGWTHDGTYMRDALMHRLVEPLGLDIQDWRPAIVYLSGEYWGIHNIRERQDRHTLGIRHNVNSDAIDLLTGDGYATFGSHTDFRNLHTYTVNNDLAEEEHFQYVVSQLDEKNIADYFIAQIYSANDDWPGNNIDYWRSTDPPTRWRWIFYDVEWRALGHIYPDNYRHENLQFALEHPHRTSQIIRSMLDNPGYRDYFINRFADLLNSIFIPSHVIGTMEEMAAVLRPHMEEHIARWGRPRNVPEWENAFEIIREFARQRPHYVRGHLADYFGLEGSFRLTVINNRPGAGSIRVNTLELDDMLPEWEGVYFRGLPIELEAHPNPGFRFTGWDGEPTTTTLAFSHTFQEDAVLTARFELDEDYVYSGNGPSPWPLLTGPYHFESWPEDSPPGTYPPSMHFRQGPGPDPSLDASLEDLWPLPYNRNNRSRYVGFDDRGVGIINTANPQEDGGGYVGSIVLALDTRGCEEVLVSFLAGTKINNPRQHAIRLRYRIGDEGSFHDIRDINGKAVKYRGAANPGHELAFRDIPLPPHLLDRGYIQLEWRYHHIGSGNSGPRDKLRLDDIHVIAPRDMELWMIY